MVAFKLDFPSRRSLIFQPDRPIGLCTATRGSGTAKAGYVIASSSQSLTDTTHLRPSYRSAAGGFTRPPPSATSSTLYPPSLYARVLVRRKSKRAKLSCERFSATTTIATTAIDSSPFPPFLRSSNPYHVVSALP